MNINSNKIIRNTLVSLFLLTANLLCAQTNSVQDSLLKALPTLKDTDKLHAIYLLANHNINNILGKQYCNMLMEEARKQGNIQYEEQGLATLVRWYFPIYENDSVFIVCEQTIQFARKHEITPLLFYAYQTMIQRYSNQERYLKALSKAEEAYAEAKELNDYESLARIATAIGVTYSRLKQSEAAIPFFQESIDWMRKADVPTAWLPIDNYIYMASSASGLNRYEDALQYIDSIRAILNMRDLSDPIAQNYSFQAECQTAIASSYLKQPKAAFEAIQQAEKLYDPARSQIGHVTLQEAYSAYYRNINEHKKSLEYINKIIDHYEENDLNSGLLTQLNRKAYALFELEEYKDVATIYRYMIDTNDSINQVKFYEQINEFKTIFELDKAEREIEQQKLSIRAQRNMITGLACSSILLLIIGLLVYIHSRRLRAKNRLLYRQIQEQDRLSEEIEEKITYINQNSDDGELVRNGRLFAALKELLKDETILAQTDIDRKSIAERLNTNEKYLFDSIKEHTGLSFSEYINEMRLNLAKKLLLDESNYTVEDIAIRAGFGSGRTFYRRFREKYNLSPIEYRKAGTEEK